MVRGTGATVSGRAVDFAQAAYADGFAEVDVSGDSCGADVEPRKGGKLVDHGGEGGGDGGEELAEAGCDG